jgi:hypothetical protein
MPGRPDLPDADPLAYSSEEAKDRWSLPRARKRTWRPKDPLEKRGRPAQVFVESSRFILVELSPVRLRRGVLFFSSPF